MHAGRAGWKRNIAALPERPQPLLPSCDAPGPADWGAPVFRPGRPFAAQPDAHGSSCTAPVPPRNALAERVPRTRRPASEPGRSSPGWSSSWTGRSDPPWIGISALPRGGMGPSRRVRSLRWSAPPEMRWLLGCLCGSVGSGGPKSRSLTRLRAVTVRVRRRGENHRTRREVAGLEFDRISWRSIRRPTPPGWTGDSRGPGMGLRARSWLAQNHQEGRG